VTEKLLHEFNAYVSAMRQTFGVPIEEIVRGIKQGVRNVEIAAWR